MITVIGLTQFVFLSLGIMALKIIIKASRITEPLTQQADFLNKYSFWLFLIPFIWIVCAQIFDSFKPSPLATRTAQVTGIFLCIAIFLAFALAIIYPTVNPA